MHLYIQIRIQGVDVWVRGNNDIQAICNGSGPLGPLGPLRVLRTARAARTTSGSYVAKVRYAVTAHTSNTRRMGHYGIHAESMDWSGYNIPTK